MSPTSYGMSFSLSRGTNTALLDNRLGPPTQGKPGLGKANFSPFQPNPFCGFSIVGSVSPAYETKSGMDKDGHTLPFDAEPHYADLVLQCSQPASKRRRAQARCDGAPLSKTASPTEDKGRSLRERPRVENLFPSIQNAPPEIPVEN